MLRIATLNGHERISTQDLLGQIASAVANGETDFYVAASGQHDIGGPLWSPSGRELHFKVTNPGQRVGAMCLPGTVITVDGSAPADVGWLNSGGEITIRGDAGDTAGHCAASGAIYIGGRAGTRSGSLMKHDPELSEPELWVLNSVGSFSFEFMSGGRAVVCGHDSQILPSVLGERPGVGMVGGAVFFRGPHAELPPDVSLEPLDENDIAWLDRGLDTFLQKIGRPQLKPELCIWKHWAKLIPAKTAAQPQKQPVDRFHASAWFENGLFAGVIADDGAVADLVPTGDYRLNIPHWENAEDRCTDCRQCLESCPRAAIIRREAKGPVYRANERRCIGCGICAAICPKSVWQMQGLPYA